MAMVEWIDIHIFSHNTSKILDKIVKEQMSQSFENKRDKQQILKSLFIKTSQTSRKNSDIFTLD